MTNRNTGKGNNGGTTKQAGSSIKDHKKQLQWAGAPISVIRKEIRAIKKAVKQTNWINRTTKYLMA